MEFPRSPEQNFYNSLVLMFDKELTEESQHILLRHNDYYKSESQKFLSSIPHRNNTSPGFFAELWNKLPFSIQPPQEKIYYSGGQFVSQIFEEKDQQIPNEIPRVLYLRWSRATVVFLVSGYASTASDPFLRSELFSIMKFMLSKSVSKAPAEENAYLDDKWIFNLVNELMRKDRLQEYRKRLLKNYINNPNIDISNPDRN